ncbi:MAG: M28 family peptidase, partial [Bacteroidetes bacterium]|jgi:hypothetical protein|nr:M28 family peptidase [Bacteroidota bacterium]
MGPRVPNTEAHREALQFYKDHFNRTAGAESVYVQSFQQEVYGDMLQLHNVIASFGTDHRDRILLAAHWDSRPRSEYDPVSPELPVPGADDGASGVGVLMELARIFSVNPPPVGVDLILFDGEDYGKERDLHYYFLGSRYWSNNPPVPGYSPRFGILVDMVGGKEATFTKELHSLSFAPNLVDEIWSVGQDLGYEHYFLDERGGRIGNDHMIVEEITGIPMIVIINHRRDENGRVQFSEYWHTQSDTMEQIGRETLQAVGDVLLELIYNRIPDGIHEN